MRKRERRNIENGSEENGLKVYPNKSEKMKRNLSQLEKKKKKFKMKQIKSGRKKYWKERKLRR